MMQEQEIVIIGHFHLIVAQKDGIVAMKMEQESFVKHELNKPFGILPAKGQSNKAAPRLP